MTGSTAEDLPTLRLLHVLHEAFVEARAIGYATGDARLIDLGDTFEIIPTLMARPEAGNLDLIRDLLRRHRAKHGGRDFAAVLDMNEERFRALYGPAVWPDDGAAANADDRHALNSGERT